MTIFLIFPSKNIDFTLDATESLLPTFLEQGLFHTISELPRTFETLLFVRALLEGCGLQQTRTIVND